MDTPLGQDHFTDVDGTLLRDHVPDLGNSWIRSNFNAPVELAIASNMVAIDQDEGSRSDEFYINIDDVADGYVQAVFKTILASRYPGLFARHTPGTDGGVFIYPGTLNTFVIFDSETTNMETITGMPWAGNPLIRMELESGDVRVFYNGTLKATFAGFTTIITGKFGIKAIFKPV